MGQKVNPVGLRLGIIRGWDSNWFGGKNFASKIVEDDKIRRYLNARLFKAGISKINVGTELRQAYETAIKRTNSIQNAQQAVYEKVLWVINEMLGIKNSRDLIFDGQSE